MVFWQLISLGVLLCPAGVHSRRAGTNGQPVKGAGSWLEAHLQIEEEDESDYEGDELDSPPPNDTQDALLKLLGSGRGLSCAVGANGLSPVDAEDKALADKRLGCNLGCDCPLVQRCYMRHALHEGDSVDVGVCAYSVPLMVTGSVLIFFTFLAAVVCARALLIHCAMCNEASYAAQLTPRGSVQRIGSTPRRNSSSGKARGDAPSTPRTPRQEAPKRDAGRVAQDEVAANKSPSIAEAEQETNGQSQNGSAEALVSPRRISFPSPQDDESGGEKAKPSS
eukprot:TRINITY_DN30822_c0_g1_i2.p1 TRINITY_DN30822_c0_g1~~TRINITY_DN30822_c0_g1_i2.p1  ORF type:complete len:280 (+),score=49.77 TRINITY_DN30822_c0_g1_i2:104-943(+)